MEKVTLKYAHFLASMFDFWGVISLTLIDDPADFEDRKALSVVNQFLDLIAKVQLNPEAQGQLTREGLRGRERGVRRLPTFHGKMRQNSSNKF